jgi:hypothetical protein
LNAASSRTSTGHHAALLEELGELVGLELVGRPRQHGREELEDRLLVGEPLVPRTDDLAALHDEEHRDALHLEGLRQATVLVAVDLDDLDLPLELLGDLLDDGRLDFAGLAPVCVEVDEDGQLRADHFLLEGRLGDGQDGHGSCSGARSGRCSGGCARALPYPPGARLPTPSMGGAAALW